jgi:hypothetical protein
MSNETVNSSPCCSTKCWSVFGYVVAVAGGLLILWGVNEMLRSYTVPVEKNTREARAAERRSERGKLLQAEAAEDNYGWINKQKGMVRLTLERGMELTVAEYGNKKSARAKLNARLEKANAQPPKAPEPPSNFE